MGSRERGRSAGARPLSDHRDRAAVGADHADHPGRRELPRGGLPHRPVAARAGELCGQARRRDRHRGDMTNVLEGIRVLDFGRYIAGPYCAALLADLGADVIRIERIGGGEDRWVAPINDDRIGAMYVTMNRNKRGMTLDPSSPEGREIVKKLVATADVVVANLPPEGLRSLSLDLESLRGVKPGTLLPPPPAVWSGGPGGHKQRVRGRRPGVVGRPA